MKLEVRRTVITIHEKDLHALAEVALVSHNDESAYLTESRLAVKDGAEVRGIASSAWVALTCRFRPEHLENLGV